MKKLIDDIQGGSKDDLQIAINVNGISTIPLIVNRENKIKNEIIKKLVQVKILDTENKQRPKFNVFVENNIVNDKTFKDLDIKTLETLYVHKNSKDEEIELEITLIDKYGVEQTQYISVYKSGIFFDVIRARFRIPDPLTFYYDDHPESNYLEVYFGNEKIEYNNEITFKDLGIENGSRLTIIIRKYLSALRVENFMSPFPILNKYLGSHNDELTFYVRSVPNAGIDIVDGYVADFIAGIERIRGKESQVWSMGVEKAIYDDAYIQLRICFDDCLLVFQVPTVATKPYGLNHELEGYVVPWNVVGETNFFEIVQFYDIIMFNNIKFLELNEDALRQFQDNHE